MSSAAKSRHLAANTACHLDCRLFRELLTPLAALSVPASASTATAATAATAPLRALRLGLIDHDISAMEIGVVQGLDRRHGVFSGRHLHKPESSGFAAEPVLDDAGGLDVAVRGEKLPQIVVRNLEGKVSHINVHFSAPLVRNRTPPELATRRHTASDCISIQSYHPFYTT